MKHQWLQQHESAQNVIVFFSGWGFDTSVVQNLIINDDTDVLFVDDFRSLDTEIPTLDHYKKRNLIAWSFGIAAYHAWQVKQRNAPHFHHTVAINGSMSPVNRRAGIPEIIMQKTIDTLSIDSFQVFASKCFEQREFVHLQPFAIDVEARKEELINIQQRQAPDTPMQWNKVWISRHDKIFPLRNLQRAWQDHGDCVEVIDATHAPFAYWQNWQDIIA